MSVGLLLVFLAIAVEDVRVRSAPVRAWAVFRKGWWAFLLVAGLSVVFSVAVALLLLPLAFAAPLALLDPVTGGGLLVLCCAITGPLALGTLLLTAVYTNVLYTLVYRAAAKLIDAPTGPDATPPASIA